MKTYMLLRYERGHCRYSSWILIFGIICIINLPNFFPWEKTIYPDTYFYDYIDRLMKSALICCMFLSFFKTPWVGWLAIWLLALWWQPISIATRILTGSPITSNLIGTALSSSRSELMNLLDIISLNWILYFILWNILCFLALLSLKRIKKIKWNGRMRSKIIIFSLALLAVPYVFLGKRWQLNWIENKENSLSGDIFAQADSFIGIDSDLPFAFPYELPFSIAQYFQARSAIDKVKKGLKSPDDQIILDERSPNLVVLVIGESSSRKYWSLFDYRESDTTPRLKKRFEQKGDIYKISNLLAQTTSTRQAVPSLLSDQPIIWPNGQPNAQATYSILSMAAEAGYATAWLSNQSAIGRFDGVIAAYADEAQTRSFLNPSSFSQQGTYDEVLFFPFEREVRSNRRSFIVVHTLGSHFNFVHRYPTKFSQQRETNSIEEEYKSSILYTDYVLDGLIRYLDASAKSAVMLYVSDHGQGLPDVSCRQREINRVTSDSYEIPGFVWLSEKYRKDNPKIVTALQKNSPMAYTNSAVYGSLIDLIESKEKIEMKRVRSSFLHTPSNDAVQIVIAPNQKSVEYRVAKKNNRCFIGLGK